MTADSNCRTLHVSIVSQVLLLSFTMVTNVSENEKCVHVDE